MGDLASTDVTLTIAKNGRTYAGYARMNVVTLAVGDGSKTVPSAGYISLPTDKKLYGAGPNLSILDIIVTGMPSTGYLYKVDWVNWRLYIFESTGSAAAFTAVNSGALAATTLTLLVLAR